MDNIHDNVEELRSVEQAQKILTNAEIMIDMLANDLAENKRLKPNKYSINVIRKTEGKLIKFFCDQITAKQFVVKQNLKCRYDQYPSLIKWLQVVGVGGKLFHALMGKDISVEELMVLREKEELQKVVDKLGGDKEDERKLSSALKHLTNFLSMKSKRSDAGGRNVGSINLMDFHWDSWCKSNEEDVFVSVDQETNNFPTNAINIQPNSKNGTLNSEGTSRHGSESSSNSHQSHQSRTRSETDQASFSIENSGEMLITSQSQSRQQSTSSGPPPPSPSYASSYESDGSFCINGAGTFRSGSSPPSQYSNKLLSSFSSSKSPIMAHKANLFVPTINKSASTESNLSGNFFNDNVSSSTQSIDSSMSRKMDKQAPRKKKPKAPVKKQKDDANMLMHMSWSQYNPKSCDNSPCFLTPNTPKTKTNPFVYPDITTKQFQTSKLPNSKTKNTMKETIKRFFWKPKPGESHHDAMMTSSVRQPRDRFPSTPVMSSGKRSPVNITTSSTKLTRKDYSFNASDSLTASPCMMRAKDDAFADVTDTIDTPDVVGHLPVAAQSISSSTSKLTDTNKTLTPEFPLNSSTPGTLVDTNMSSASVSFPASVSDRERIFQQNSYLQIEEWDVPFNELELKEIIGSGQVGTVYRGFWHGNVAIRVIETKHNDEEKLRAFKQEINIYKKTRHENIELYMASCTSPPKLAIVTGYCKDSLYNLIRNKSIHWLTKKSIIAQHIAQGMGYLHSKKIVHKDLKSKNVFYDGKNYVITDFGLIGLRAACGNNSEGIKTDTLKIPKGWLSYLAPEIITALRFPSHDNDDVIATLPYTQQTDVYAFGSLWYEISTGSLPFDGRPAEYVIIQVGYGRKPSFTQIPGGRDVKDLLMWCWSPDPSKRPDFSFGIQGALKKQLPHQLQRVMSSHLPHKGSGLSVRSPSCRDEEMFKHSDHLSNIKPFKAPIEK